MDLRTSAIASGAIAFAIFIGIITGTGALIATTPPTTQSTSLNVIIETPPPSPPALSAQAGLPDPTPSVLQKPKAKTPLNAPFDGASGELPAKKPEVLAQPTQTDFDTAAGTLREALVNILCISHDTRIHSTSGSGVIVDPRGVIVTNAHIAQYFLLASDPSLKTSCVIRRGSPAQTAYRAKLMFISPAWIRANADVLSKTHPTGSGENDFAFLSITGSTSLTTSESETSAPLPATHPFIPLTRDEAYADEPVVIGSYAAQFLTAGEVQSSLYPTIVFGMVKAIFTFTDQTIDVVALGGSAAAQEGSSGGGIARADGTLAGVITTSTIEGDTSTRNLSGITASYIRRDYAAETSATLEELFAKSPTEAVEDFAPQISGLLAVLTASFSN
ncbi:MAG: serine protease [bacterium]|nr:serine protease [bacterium]